MLGTLDMLLLASVVFFAFTTLVWPAYLRWRELGTQEVVRNSVEPGPYTFLATDLDEYAQTYDVRERYKQLRIAYLDELRGWPPGGERSLLNRWELLAPHALRYKISFDYCYGFAY
jgi:hypothetical protein